jgi:hypothetical protein
MCSSPEVGGLRQGLRAHPGLGLRRNPLWFPEPLREDLGQSCGTVWNRSEPLTPAPSLVMLVSTQHSVSATEESLKTLFFVA